MPARKQTRRSISISGATYRKLAAYCKIQNKSLSGTVEEMLCTFFHISKPVKPTSKPKSKAMKSKRRIVDDYIDEPMNVSSHEKPFECSTYKKEPIEKATPKPLGGGGVHQL